MPVVQNSHIKDLLGLKRIKLFEIGTVWKDNKEETNLYSIDADSHTMKGNQSHTQGTQTPEISLDEYIKKHNIVSPTQYEEYPISTLNQYKPFSHYPYIVRDIALWVPADTQSDEVQNVIAKSAGDLMVRIDKFDEFKKGEKTSYAFRLVFQSNEKTLTDDEANAAMNAVYEAVKAKEWDVR